MRKLLERFSSSTNAPEHVVLTTDIPGLVRHASGKVRDVYRVGEDALLLVASDRISAFDVVMRQGIPDKGRVLTQTARFWFDKTASFQPNHILSIDDAEIADTIAAHGAVVTETVRQMLRGRAMLCRRTRPLPIEAVVRGYLSGSAWKDYRHAPTQGGTLDLWGVILPTGLQESEKFPQPVFTPSTKATAGHDEPMPYDKISDYIGDYARPVEAASLALYNFASDYARERGIVLADTKFEFGVDDKGNLLLIDEALTPDSSRFWDAETYAPGHAQPSFDKQFVRDFLETVPGWNKQAPAPDLPPEIIARTADKYRAAYQLLTGHSLPA